MNRPNFWRWKFCCQNFAIWMIIPMKIPMFSSHTVLAKNSKVDFFSIIFKKNDNWISTFLTRIIRNILTHNNYFFWSREKTASVVPDLTSISIFALPEKRCPFMSTKSYVASVWKNEDHSGTISQLAEIFQFSDSLFS